MLIVSRKVNERIIIGNDVILTVVSIRGSVVLIGVDVPRAVPVHLGEIYASKKRSRRVMRAFTVDPKQEGGKRR